MRTHHWLTAFLCGAFLLGAGNAEAQTPPGIAQFNSHAPIDASGVPTGYAYPYPAISPFEHAFEQTSNDNGIWITESRNDYQNQYRFSVEAIFAKIKSPKSDPVSYEEASIPQAFFDNGENSILNDGSQIRLPLAVLDEAKAFNNGRGAYAPFDSGLIDQSDSTGLQLQFNIERSDGIGFELGGLGIWPSVEAAETGVPVLRIGPDGPNTGGVTSIQDQEIGHPGFTPAGLGFSSNLTSPGPFNTIATDIIDFDSVGIFNPGIRLFDGSELGTIQRFDAYMRTEMISELYGAHVNILHNASRKVGPFTVRPLFGVRYLNSKELFRVEGHDSGTDYEVAFDALTDPDGRDALLPGGGEEVDAFIRSPYRAYIDSDTETHLAGPEIGWQYAAGGEHFKLVGETRIGLMGARQAQTLRTTGIGQPYLIDDANPPAGFAGFNPLYDPFLETFDEDSTSYVTPTFHQSFDTTSRPFAYVPILRSYRFFREANLKAGWSFLLIGQMQRPNEQILYQSGNGAVTEEFVALFPGYSFYPIGDPDLIPEVKKDRSVYFVNYFNLGVEWKY